MSGRHAAPRIPFALVVGALLLIAGIGWVAVGGEDARGGGPSASPRPSASAAASAARPSRTPGASPDRGSLLIHATGDVSLDPSYIPALRTNGYAWAWSGMDGLFRHDDLTIVNHECPSTRLVAPVPKEFNFRCDPAALPAAHAAGVDVANLGNNHAYDQGPQGLLDSLRNIRRAGIAPVGAGTDEADALRPAMFVLNGWRVAVLGFDEVLDPLDEVAGPDKPGTAAGHSEAAKLRAIRDADAHADLVVVMIHWGVELDTQPREYQVQEGHAMIDAGADMIFGGHSHRLQPMETYHGRPIFYSLGNFVWPNLSVAGSTTAVAEVTVTPRGRFRGRLLPAFITAPGHPVLR
jgi:poly-gamma-glutamate synthesis protein (capsule biosynthesis protein)